MATYVLGDIQGCYREFRSLLDAVGFNREQDKLWFVGDLINRGPNNIDTLRFVMDLPDSVVVLGNHDLHFLAIARGHARPKGKDSITDLLAAPDLADLCNWLRQQPLMHIDHSRKTVMVHAGLPPCWDTPTCRARAREVEAILQGNDPDTFFAEMYGNEPATWSDSLTGNDRLRLITNYFTRLRFCKPDGTLELDSKETEAPAGGYLPWYDLPRPDDYTIVFGHWAAIQGITGNPRAISVDTGCVWGRQLTALRLDDGRKFSVDSETVVQG